MSRTDAEVAAALARGDQSALAEVYDRYGGLAYSVAVRMLGDRGRAEDAVQDAFLGLWRGASRFDANKGSLRSWLVAAVRNRAIDMLRGRSLHERRELTLRPDVEAVGSSPEEAAAGEQERAAVRAALGELPHEQREAVLLAYFGGFTQPEIAEIAGVPLSTVKGRMRLAMEKLASYLKARGLVDV